ncbi:MAG: carboxypeptidase regulatory-like domain-containing protein, partial [Candidatus Marinimicrobia bacterium]|nr:carboxypeptidase regulatory-like domain-containing protein [Candidatus Neomarinimicrobiota bacterium]
ISTDDGDDTYANNDGSYSLSVQPGTYDVTAHLVGYNDDVATGVTVNSEQTVNVDFTLNAIPTVAVFGQVIEFGTGNPLSGATVTLSGYADFGAITAPNGNFNIQGVFSGQTYNVEVAYGNLETFFTSINVGANDYDMGVIELSEFVYPPTDLTAQVVNYNDVVLNWHSPTGEEPPPPGGDGDTIEDAMLVTEIPFMDTQDTNGFSDDYDEECPYTGSTSSDVVYMWNADPGDYYLSICDSDYDTKLYLYDENQSVVECVDDSCEDPAGNPWRSDFNLSITTAGTYYVVVDGYGGQNGVYNLSIEEGTVVRDVEIYQPPKPIFDEVSVEEDTRDRELLGYNIYRNGSLIEEVFPDTLYVDNNVPNGFHIFGVRAVYTSGISDAITVEVVVDAPLVADFEGNPTDGFAPLTVQFTDMSMDFGTPIVAWFWDFGDGGTSNVQNPSHTYTMQGTYDVSLMILDMSGTSAQETKYDYINVMSEPGPGEFINSLTATGDGISYPMSFGFAANATDGFDPGIDLYAPPAPPPPSFDAALGWDGDRYYTQILAVDIGVEKIYDVLLQYPDDNTIVLNWDNTGWSGLGTFILQDAFGGVFVDEDMTQINSITLTNPALTILKLKVTAGEGPPPGDTDDIDLMSNWNLMSFDVDIENNEPADVFASLIADGNLVYVTGFGEDGATFFDPNGPGFLNTLTSIDAGAGYWVKVNNGAMLTAAGMGIPSNFSTDLFGGWNILGYWLDGSMAPEDAFADLIADGNLVYVTGFGEDGATFFDPNGPGFLNTLTALENGYGYWVKVNNDVPGFQYPAGNGFSARQVALNVNPEIIKTNKFMFMNGSVSFDHIDFFIGDKVSVQTQDGILIGEMEILEDGNLMTTAVYGDDNTTTAKDGAEEGESLVFTYGEYESHPVSIEFTPNMELKKVDLFFQNLPEEFGLTQNFPNPFNPVTTIQYMVPDAADIQLVVYDLMGKTVRTLVNGSQTAGYKTVVWDSKDNNGIPVSAGMYIYELRSGSFSVIQKMVLLK